MRSVDAGTRRVLSSVDRAWMGLLSTGASAAVLPIRLLVSLVFLAHACQKLFGWFGGAGPAGAGAGFEQMGFQPGVLWAVVAGLIEMSGGLLLVFGLLSRLAAGLLALEMLVAMFVVHWPNGFFLNWTGGPGGHGIEFSLALIASLLAVMLYGGGFASLDRLIVRQRTPAAATTPPL